MKCANCKKSLSVEVEESIETCYYIFYLCLDCNIIIGEYLHDKMGKFK